MHHLQHIAELAPCMEKMGIRHVVISPGSRNAPLIQLFTSNKHFSCHSIVDERSAGYVALGMALQSGRPVAVITTSGTAVLNLSPAVAEAFHQQLPLLLITADRPREIYPQFNNQVTDQRAPYFNHSKGFFEFPAELRNQEDMERGLQAVEKLLTGAQQLPAGPVHLNLPLAEPLYVPLPEPGRSALKDSAAAGASPEEELPFPDVSVDMRDKKVLVLAGMGEYPEGFCSALEGLAARSDLVVLAENISNLVSERFISVPELLLAGASEAEKAALQPELVLMTGGQVVSKRMKLFIQGIKDLEVIQIPPTVEALDQLVVRNETSAGSYRETWADLANRELERAQNYLNCAPYGNLSAVSHLLKGAPPGTVVHLGNSTTVRYSQFLAARSDLIYRSNRGTSGIDGSLSTAVGAAMVSEQEHLLLLGDLSFVYDSNGLWNKDFPENLKIVVINDGGGGIFRLLEGPNRMEYFEEFSVTQHPVSLELLATSFGRSFASVKGMDELEERMDELFRPGTGLSVLEVDTSNSENSRIFKDLFK